MTLIFGYRTPSTEQYRSDGIIIGSDTISTRQDIAGHDSFGKTSQNQIISPKMNGDHAEYFSEDSCKIGVLNQHVLVSASGNNELILKILRFYYDTPNKIKNYSDFFPYFTDNLCVSLSPLNNLPLGTTAEFLFAIFDSGHVTFVDMIYVIENGHMLKHAGSYFFPGSMTPSYFKGSGHPLMSDFSGSFHFAWNSTLDASTIQQSVSLEVSNHVTKRTFGNANSGVGGAILTIGIDAEGVKYPQDTIYFFSDKDGEVSVLTKIIYRDGLIYVTDLIEKQIRCFMTLDRHFKRPPTNQEFLQKKNINAALLFDANWLFLVKKLPHDSNSELKFENFVNGNPTGSVMGSLQGGNPSITNIKGARMHLTFVNESGPNKIVELKIKK